VQLGGGLRSLEQLDAAFDLGVRRGVIGTAAHDNPGFVRRACRQFEGRIAVGIDARNGFVATRGWKVVSETRAVDFALQMQDDGVELVIYTDIGRDGILEGPNLGAIEQLARSLKIPVIASGGISTLDDLAALRAIESSGVTGVIVGRALYERRFTLAEAIAATR
jgi:phosphoribosylformimino-5-aminoimidazole carboxamide ribotide isomerase